MPRWEPDARERFELDIESVFRFEQSDRQQKWLVVCDKCFDGVRQRLLHHHGAIKTVRIGFNQMQLARFHTIPTKGFHQLCVDTDDGIELAQGNAAQ